MHTYIHTVHAYIHTDRQTDRQAHDMHACTHTYIHNRFHAYIYTDVHTYIHTHIHPYIHACKHTCIHTCLHAYTHAHTHTTHAHTHTFTHTHTFIHTYIHISKPTYTQTDSLDADALESLLKYGRAGVCARQQWIFPKEIARILNCHVFLANTIKDTQKRMLPKSKCANAPGVPLAEPARQLGRYVPPPLLH